MGLANDLTSWAASAVRLGVGIEQAAGARAPEKRLLLYDFEACPFCRKAREALSHLGIEVEVRPCGKGSPRRDELAERGGRVMVPYLVDPNTNREMYESDDIVRYLYDAYGTGSPPTMLRIGGLGTALSFGTSSLRPTRGLVARVRRAKAPEKLLELYNMESSPYCRKVREALVEVDLPYLCRNAPKGSPVREELERRGGRFMVPYLVDPNTGTAMYESDEIVSYLETTYGA